MQGTSEEVRAIHLAKLNHIRDMLAADNSATSRAVMMSLKAKFGSGITPGAIARTRNAMGIASPATANIAKAISLRWKKRRHKPHPNHKEVDLDTDRFGKTLLGQMTQIASRYNLEVLHFVARGEDGKPSLTVSHTVTRRYKE